MPKAIDKSSASNFLQVGAGIRNWAEETSSAHLFSGKVFVHMNIIIITYLIKDKVIVNTHIIINHKAIVKDINSTNTTLILRIHHY